MSAHLSIAEYRRLTAGASAGARVHRRSGNSPLEPSKLEGRYTTHLIGEMYAGRVKAYKWPAPSFPLSGTTPRFYTPDHLVWLADGTIRCWGDNTAGQLGRVPTLKFSHTSLPIDLAR